MKNVKKKIKILNDDNLFGLLSIYKSYVTYFLILESEEDDRIVLILSDNPGNWLKSLYDDTVVEEDGQDENNITVKDEVNFIEKYKNYTSLRRLEIGCDRLSIKYLLPIHIVTEMGPLLGIKIATKSVTIIDRLKHEGYYILEASLNYKDKIITILNKFLSLTAHKKYEILEKCMDIKEEKEG